LCISESESPTGWGEQIGIYSSSRIDANSFRSLAVPHLGSWGFALVNPPIGQALADDALYGLLGALCIRHAQLGAVVVAEIKLRQITVQVLLVAVPDVVASLSQ
jgi:hypothetical protein